MKRIVFAFALVFMVGTARAEAPTDKYPVPKQELVDGTGQKLDKNTPFALGDVVIITLSDRGKVDPTLQATDVKWRVRKYDPATGALVPIRVNPYQGGVFFGSGLEPRRLYVEAVVTHLFVQKLGADKVEAATRTVILDGEAVIGGAVPTPPAPGPTPPPTPLPDGKFGLTKFAIESLGLVDAKYRGLGAGALAKTCRGLASQIAAGTVRASTDAERKAMLAEFKVENSKALAAAGVPADAFDSFGNAVAAKMFQLYQGKQLKAAADYKAAFDELAAGLEAFR